MVQNRTLHIDHVIRSEKFFTIFFRESLGIEDSLEILRVSFKGMAKPKAGDTFKISQIEGKTTFYLNGVEVGSRRTYIFAPKEIQDAWERRRLARAKHLEVIANKKKAGLI